MLRLYRTIPVILSHSYCISGQITKRFFSRHHKSHDFKIGLYLETLDNQIWNEMKNIPCDKHYKQKLNEKRRVLIQEDEDEDAEVIYWDENTRPEDIMEGEDLEEYYKSARRFFKKDSSSNDKEQIKDFDEISKILGITPTDVDGYKTYFEDNQSLDSGLPEEIAGAFNYFDTLLEEHPELQMEYDKWNQQLDKLSNMNVRTMSNAEFQKLAACPESIMHYVDEEHKPLFRVKRSEFLKPRTHVQSQVSSVDKEEDNVKEPEKKELPNSLPKGNLQSKIAKTINIMFDSLWKDNPPITIDYVSNGSKLHDVFIYIKPEVGFENINKEHIMDILTQHSDNFNEMLGVAFRLDKLPNVQFRFVDQE